METNPFKNEKILTLGFCLRILPEVVLECVSDAASWAVERIDDALADFGPDD